MTLVADEGVESGIVDRLRSDGHEVIYIAELEPGLTDDQVLERATEAGSPLLTNDKDFGELVFRLGRAHDGVILLRLAGLSQNRKADVVSAVLRAHADELHGAFSVITPEQVRIRSGA